MLIVVLATFLATASPFDGGGNVALYEIANAANTAPIEGVCLSACTMRLSTAACVDRHAELGFHAARQAGDGVVSALGTAEVAAHYRPGLRAWFYAGDISRLRVLRGVQLARFGYRLCPSSQEGRR